MRKAGVVALLITSFAALAAKPCQDCWDDTCKEFKGALPKCAAPVPVKTPKKKGVELNVKSTPAGATISVEGIALGKTPWRGRLDVAPREVELSKVGFETVKVTLVAPYTVNQTLVPLATGFTLALTPAVTANTVLVDSKPVESHKDVFVVSAGSHEVEVQANGYSVARGTVTVARGVVSTLALTLQAKVEAARGLVVTSAPPGAVVTIDGRSAGVTPLKDTSIENGPHQVQLSLQGYDDARAEVTAPGQQSFTLFPSDTPVVIESKPPGAIVAIDGRKIGSTPLVARLGPGRRVVRLELAGHQRLEESKELLPSETPTWSFELVPSAPMVGMLPPAPAMPPLQTQALEAATPNLAALLGDPAIDLEQKRVALQNFAVMTDDVTRFVFAAQPQRHRDALCDTFRMKVRSSRLMVQVFDSYGDEARALIDLDGHRLGRSPFDGNVPVCARTISVTLDDEVVKRERELDGAGKVERFDMPGRQRRVAFSAFVDQLWLPALTLSDLKNDERDVSTSNTGFGVRFDAYGKIFHASIALKASQLFGLKIFQQSTRSFGPSADVYVGLTTAGGNDLVRYRFAFDVGAWSLLCPSVRIVNTVSLFEHIFFSLTLDAAWVPPTMINSLNVNITNSAAERMFGIGTSFAIGGGF